MIALSLGVSGCGRKRPDLNVLLITLDTVRADRFGFDGYDRPTSPNLDHLARESVVFDFAIAQAAVTPVSHASILTGLEPYHHFLRVFHGTEGNRLDRARPTLAEIWARAGGQSAAFVSAFPVTAAFGLERGFRHFDCAFPRSDGRGLVSPRGMVNTAESQRAAPATTEACLAWLRGRRHSFSARPLLLWVHYFDPHDTVLVPPRSEAREMLRDAFPPASPEPADRMRAIYDFEIHYMDRQIGRLLDEFRAQGLWGETVVVVVGDHGEGLGDHGWWSHGILYQEQIHVPLLIRVPGIAGGRRVASLVRTIDVMPTILEAAGVDRAQWPEMDGRSLLETVRSGEVAQPRVAYSESVNILNYGRPDLPRYWDRKRDKLYSLIVGTDKLIYHQLDPAKTELYDLSQDPGEQHDLSTERPELVAEMVERLKGLDALSDIMPSPFTTDAENVKMLESLGYVEGCVGPR